MIFTQHNQVELIGLKDLANYYQLQNSDMAKEKIITLLSEALASIEFNKQEKIDTIFVVNSEDESFNLYLGLDYSEEDSKKMVDNYSTLNDVLYNLKTHEHPNLELAIQKISDSCYNILDLIDDIIAENKWNDDK